MANIDRPNGAKSTGRTLTGGSCQPAVEYDVDASNSTAIFIGDFMIREADGNVAPYTGTGGGNLLGACAGIKDDYDNLNRRYLPASTAGTVYVIDDPDTVFAIQEDDAGTALTAAAGGANCDVLATAGDTTSGISRHEIDRSTVGSSAAQLRLIRLVPRADNDYGDSAEWEVVINEHVYKSTTGV